MKIPQHTHVHGLQEEQQKDIKNFNRSYVASIQFKTDNYLRRAKREQQLHFTVARKLLGPSFKAFLSAQERNVNET